MASSVIFDFYGTLAKWDHESPSNYAAVIARYGYEVDPFVIDTYLSCWDGIDHHEHSGSREDYLAWTRSRLQGLAHDCGVPEKQKDSVVDALVASDVGAAMVAFPESVSVLLELKRRNFRLAVCSNWGWDLEVYLEETGIAPLIDVPVTSARAGFRKPHPLIYEQTLATLGVRAEDAIFVGDSWRPDVLGPISVGMTSVHVCRDPTKDLPELIDGARRIGGLEQLLSLEQFSART